MTKLLGFSQVGLASPDRLFRNLTLRDVHDRSDNLFVADLVLNGMRKITKVLCRTIRHQQPMLPVELLPALRCAPQNVRKKARIVRMRSLQYQIGRWFGAGRVTIDACRLIRPENPLRTYFHSDTAGSTQSLRICQMRSTSPKLGFGLFALLNVEIDADPAEYRSFCVPDGFGPAEKPAVSS